MSGVRDSLGLTARETDAGAEVLRCLASVPFILRVVKGKLEPVFVGKGLVELLGVAGSARFIDGWLEPWIHPHDAATAIPDYASLSSDQKIVRHLRINQANGNYRWLRQTCRRLGDGSPDDYQIAGLLSEGNRTHDLEEQQRKNSALALMAADWHWEQDAELRYTKLAPEFEHVTGLPPESILGKTRWEIVPDKNDARIDWESHQRGLAAHLAFRNFEFLGRHGGSQSDPLGRHPVWMRESGQARFDDEGRFQGYIGVATLIGELKQTDTEYQRNPPFLRTVVDRLPWATLALDDKLNSIYQNSSFEEMFNLPSGHLEHGTSIREIVRMIGAKGGYGVDDSQARMQSHVEEILDFRANVIDLQSAAGGKVTLTGSPVLVQNAPAGYVLMQTVPTEQYQPSGRRKEALDASPDNGAAAPDPDRRSAEERDRRVAEVEDARKFREMVNKIDRHYSSLFHLAPLAMSVVEMGPGNPVLLVSDAWLAQFEQTRSDVMRTSGLAFPFLKSNTDRRKLILQIERRTRFSGLEVEYQCPGSTDTKWCRASSRYFDRNDKAYLIIVFEEITEQKQAAGAMQEFNARLERSVSDRTDALQRALNDLGMVIENLHETQDKLVRSQKLAALGGMVAGIAHELNTPIGNSLMVASHLTKTSTEMEETMKTGLRRSMLDEYIADNHVTAGVLVRNLNKAAELVSSFKQVAVDRTSSQRRSFNLADMVAETVTTLGPSLRKTPFTVEQSVAADITMDSFPGPLGQVLTNLINNGIIHAFDGLTEGCIKIEAEKAEAPGQVVLRVTDNGRGIPPDALPKIFDPFFTTKRGSGGSGLGLHIVHNMVSHILSGSISVDSEPGKGSCFTLTLAITAPEQDGDAEETESES